jgi:hypothetical protein
MREWILAGERWMRTIFNVRTLCIVWAGGVLLGGGLMSGRPVVVALIIAVAMLAAGCIDPGDPSPPTTKFSAPHLEARTVNNTTVWDCTFNVTRVTPENAKLSWAGVSVIVKSAQGYVLIPSAQPGVYPGHAGPSSKAYRVEISGSWLTMDVGDSIRLTSLDEGFLDAGVEIEYKDADGTTLLGRVTMPSAFP